MAAIQTPSSQINITASSSPDEYVTRQMDHGHDASDVVVVIKNNAVVIPTINHHQRFLIDDALSKVQIVDDGLPSTSTLTSIGNESDSFHCNNQQQPSSSLSMNYSSIDQQSNIDLSCQYRHSIAIMPTLSLPVAPITDFHLTNINGVDSPIQ